jgi:hypothetical protein
MEDSDDQIEADNKFEEELWKTQHDIQQLRGQIKVLQRKLQKNIMYEQMLRKVMKIYEDKVREDELIPTQVCSDLQTTHCTNTFEQTRLGRVHL